MMIPKESNVSLISLSRSAGIFFYLLGASYRKPNSKMLKQ